MTENKLIIASMAMDLKRVALGFHYGSHATAQRFFGEALKRSGELNKGDVKPYLRKFLSKIPKLLDQKDNMQISEDALMYSTIFQNYALQK